MPVWTGQASSRVGICEQDTVWGVRKNFESLEIVRGSLAFGLAW